MPSPNPTARREFRAGVPAKLTGSGITSAGQTSFTIDATSNWPTGAVGNFLVTVDRGGTEERILCSSQSAGTLTVATSGRGYDGTTAQTHAAGATVECTFSAEWADEVNQHTSATSGVHGVAGSVVGTSDSQTLSNKTLSVPTINSAVVTGSFTSTNVTFLSSAAAQIPLLVQGAPSQTANLQEWMNNAGVVLSKVDASGNTFAPKVIVGATTDTGAHLSVVSSSASNVGVAVRAAASPTADLLECQDSTSATQVSIDSTFGLHLSANPSAGTVSSGALWGGTGAPLNSRGTNGDFYFRIDTPGTANQRLYTKSAGSWVGIV